MEQLPLPTDISQKSQGSKKLLIGILVAVLLVSGAIFGKGKFFKGDITDMPSSESSSLCGNGQSDYGEVCDTNVVQVCTTSDGQSGTRFCNSTCTGWNETCFVPAPAGSTQPPPSPATPPAPPPPPQDADTDQEEILQEQILALQQQTATPQPLPENYEPLCGDGISDTTAGEVCDVGINQLCPGQEIPTISPATATESEVAQPAQPDLSSLIYMPCNATCTGWDDTVCPPPPPNPATICTTELNGTWDSENESCVTSDVGYFWDDEEEEFHADPGLTCEARGGVLSTISMPTDIPGEEVMRFICSIKNAKYGWDEVDENYFLAATCGNGVREAPYELCDRQTISCTVSGRSGKQKCNTTCDGYLACIPSPRPARPRAR